MVSIFILSMFVQNYMMNTSLELMHCVSTHGNISIPTWSSIPYLSSQTVKAFTTLSDEGCAGQCVFDHDGGGISWMVSPKASEFVFGIEEGLYNTGAIHVLDTRPTSMNVVFGFVFRTPLNNTADKKNIFLNG